MHLNKVFLIGSSVSHATISEQEKSGQHYATFRIVTKYFSKNGSAKEVYHNIACYENLADLVYKHLVPGKKIHIEGRLDILNKKTESSCRVVAERVIFLDERVYDNEKA